MSYNPYELLPLNIDGQLTYARVIELDSEIVDQIKSTNAKKAYVVPKKVITTCPNCAYPLELEVELPQPPFPILNLSCSNCHPVIIEQSPFVDPIAAGRLTVDELQPNDIPVVTKPVIKHEDFKLEKFAKNVDKTSVIEETFETLQSGTSAASAGSSATSDSTDKKPPKKPKKS